MQIDEKVTKIDGEEVEQHCRLEVKIANVYVKCNEQFIGMFSDLELMWGGHLGRM